MNRRTFFRKLLGAALTAATGQLLVRPLGPFWRGYDQATLDYWERRTLLGQQLIQMKIMDLRQSVIVEAIDPIVVQARGMKQLGGSELEIRSFIAQQMPAALKRLRSTQMPDGNPAIAEPIDEG